jgi:hypothetical protein
MEYHYVSYYDNNNKEYETWYDGETIHRIDGPAHITYFQWELIHYEIWIQNGIYHRLDGPAMTKYQKDGTIYYKQYWIRDIQYNKETYYNHPDVIEYQLNKLINLQLT